MPRKRTSQSLPEKSQARRAIAVGSIDGDAKDSTSLYRSTWIAVVVVAVVWLVMTCAVTSRIHFVMSYVVSAMETAIYEPVAVSNVALSLLLLLAALWLILVYRVSIVNPRGVSTSLLWLSCACMPFLLWMMRVVYGDSSIPLTIFEPLWLSMFSGVALSHLLSVKPGRSSFLPSSLVFGPNVDCLIISGASSMVAAWWYLQTRVYYDDFMLGFNDFGHFAQRIASTATGRGFLLESPVLPPFWDHFNPGILLLVPLWKLTESIDMIFAVQALCLASGAVLLWRIAGALGAGRLASVLWGLAWLTHPALGQMNLAYTYGWHPVSLAIPLLLASLLQLFRQRYAWSMWLAILAGSMEENIIVIIGLFALVRAVRYFISQRFGFNRTSSIDGGLTGTVWISVAVLSCITFLMVYRFSGLAQFQAGRFAALGNSPVEVIFSPVLRPSEFWGKIFRFRTLVFLLSLLSPFYFPAIVRGCWVLLSVALPLGVLVVWDHLPAQSLAFHYPSGLLPLLWLAAIVGSLSNRLGEEPRLPNSNDSGSIDLLENSSIAASAAAFSTGLILSLFLGQFPWSSPTITDVVLRTYLTMPEMARRCDAPDGIWLTALVEEIRSEGKPVLATGRIAAHLVGCEEVETVGQFMERRDKLVAISPDGQPPLLRYQTIIIDLNERYQQTLANSHEVQEEALESGFEVKESRFEVVVLRRADRKG